MRNLLSLKAAQLLKPQVKNNGALAANTAIDTFDIKELLILAQVGDTDAAVGSTAADAAPFLEECDTVNGSYTKITGSDLTGVIAATDDGKIFGWHLGLRDTRKRFIRVNAPTADNQTDGANMAIVALSVPADGPVDAAGMGLEEIVKL